MSNIESRENLILRFRCFDRRNKVRDQLLSLIQKITELFGLHEVSSTNNSNQYDVSSNSCRLLVILLMNSEFERDRQASLYWAPTLVPLRRICFPMTCASGVFGSELKSLMILSANRFVLSLRSNSFIRYSIFFIRQSSLARFASLRIFERADQRFFVGVRLFRLGGCRLRFTRGDLGDTCRGPRTQVIGRLETFLPSVHIH